MDEMCGIGVDIESIGRFQGLRRPKNALFFEKIYTSAELAYCFSKDDPAPHLAARFAAKEAVIKALYSLGKKTIPFTSIEIFRTEDGLPSVKIHHSSYAALQSKVSLSHCEDKAIAFALLQENLPARKGRGKRG